MLKTTVSATLRTLSLLLVRTESAPTLFLRLRRAVTKRHPSSP